VILELDHAVTLTAVPPNETVLFPWFAPKLAPVIVTDVSTGPDVGERLVMLTVCAPANPAIAKSSKIGSAPIRKTLRRLI
jgi:hypothetical protein